METAGRVGNIDADEHICIVMDRGADAACSGNCAEVVGEGIGLTTTTCTPREERAAASAVAEPMQSPSGLRWMQDLDVPASAQPTHDRVE